MTDHNGPPTPATDTEGAVAGVGTSRLSEADFQRRVIDAATLYGWRHCHTRRATVRHGRVATPTSVPGWPDLVLWNPERGGVMFVELKTDKGVLSTDQQDALISLAKAGAYVDVWRPRDWERIAQ